MCELITSNDSTPPAASSDDKTPPVNGGNGYPVQPSTVVPASQQWFLSDQLVPQPSPSAFGLLTNAALGLVYGEMASERYCGSDDSILPPAGLVYGEMASERYCGSDDSILPPAATPEIFHESCKTHDLCYSSMSANKDVFDSNFLSNMRSEQPGLLFESIIYFGAVSFGGAKAFEQGQSSWTWPFRNPR